MPWCFQRPQARRMSAGSSGRVTAQGGLNASKSTIGFRSSFKDGIQRSSTTFIKSCCLQHQCKTAIPQATCFLCSVKAADHKMPLTCCHHNQAEQAIQHNYSPSKVRLRDSQGFVLSIFPPFQQGGEQRYRGTTLEQGATI